MTTMLLDPVDELTRRRLLGGAGALGAWTILAGCGSDQAAAPEAPVDEGAFPVTIEHKFGSTEIPAEPRRVLTVGITEQDPVLALGVTPVGVTEFFGERPFATWPWALEQLGDAEPQVLTEELNFERIAPCGPT